MTVDSPNQAQRSAPVRFYRLSKRFDRPLVWSTRAFSAVQSATARESDGMLRLILELGGEKPV